MRGDVNAVSRINADALRKNRGAGKLLKKLNAAEQKRREQYACPRFGVSVDELPSSNAAVSVLPIPYPSSACVHPTWRWSNANSIKNGQKASNEGGGGGGGDDGDDGGAAQTARVRRALLAAARSLALNHTSTVAQQSGQCEESLLIASLGHDGDVACEDELLLVAPAVACCTNIAALERELQRANPTWDLLRIDASVALLRSEQAFPFPLFEAAAGSAHEIHVLCYVVHGVRVFALSGKDEHAPSALPRVVGLSVANLKRVQGRAAWMMGLCARLGK